MINDLRNEMSEKETINHPKHYNKGRFEVIDVIEDWHLGFHLGNAIKYIARAEHKNNKAEDLMKALWYIERALSIKPSAICLKCTHSEMMIDGCCTEKFMIQDAVGTPIFREVCEDYNERK